MDRAECPWHAPSRRDNCRGSTDYGSRASHDVDARAECRTGEGDVRASAEIGARGGNRVRLRHLPTSPTSACVRMLFLPHVVAVRPSGLMVHQAKELAGPVAIALVIGSPVANGGVPQIIRISPLAIRWICALILYRRGQRAMSKSRNNGSLTSREYLLANEPLFLLSDQASSSGKLPPPTGTLLRLG
jgi:hypothetical protein